MCNNNIIDLIYIALKYSLCSAKQTSKDCQNLIFNYKSALEGHNILCVLIDELPTDCAPNS